MSAFDCREEKREAAFRDRAAAEDFRYLTARERRSTGCSVEFANMTKSGMAHIARWSSRDAALRKFRQLRQGGHP